jgi:hypothetical protein
MLLIGSFAIIAEHQPQVKDGEEWLGIGGGPHALPRGGAVLILAQNDISRVTQFCAVTPGKSLYLPCLETLGVQYCPTLTA